MIHPVYVDGPLKGQDHPVADGTQFVRAIDPAEWNRGLLSYECSLVTYQIRRFGFTSGGTAVTLWIASCNGEPDARTLAGMLLSPAALAACDDTPCPSTVRFRIVR